MKSTSQVLLAIVMTLTSAAGFSAEKPGPPVIANDNDIPAPFTLPEDKSMTDKQIFARYMDLALTRHNFRRAQELMLNMPEDTALGDLFQSLGAQIPVLGELFEAIRGAHNQSLDQFSAQAQTSMIRVVPVTDLFKRIHKSVVDVASSLGFTSDAIKNCEIYIQDGAKNAFTVSGNNQRIIVVLNRELVEQLDPQELGVVLAHEMGHILSKHSFKGIVDSLMMTLVARTVVAPGLQPSMVGSHIAGTEVINFGGQKCSVGHSGCGRHQSLESQSPAYNEYHKSFGGGFNQVMNQGLNLLMGFPPQAKAQIIKFYLAHLIMVMKKETSPPEAIQAMAELFNYDPNSPSIMIPHPAAIMMALSEASSALSRSHEKGADAYAASLFDKMYAAGVMVKLAGMPRDPKSKNPSADQRAVIQAVFKQVEAYLKSTQFSDRSGSVGSSHPAVALRLDGILQNGVYPEVLFLLPFYRLLLIEDMTRIQSLGNDKNAKTAKEVLPVLRRDILNLIERAIKAKPSTKTEVANSVFEKLVQYFALNKVKLLETRANVPAPYQAVIDKELDSNSTLLVETQKLLVDQLQVAATKARTESRLEVIRLLLTSTNIEELKAIHRGVQPKSVEQTRVASRNIPVDADRSPNPIVASSCESMLTAAAEAQAARAIEAAKLRQAIAASRPKVNVTVTFTPPAPKPTPKK